jgi:hypothetical protein
MKKNKTKVFTGTLVLAMLVVGLTTVVAAPKAQAADCSLVASIPSRVDYTVYATVGRQACANSVEWVWGGLYRKLLIAGEEVVNETGAGNVNGWSAKLSAPLVTNRDYYSRTTSVTGAEAKSGRVKF